MPTNYPKRPIGLPALILATWQFRLARLLLWVTRHTLWLPRRLNLTAKLVSGSIALTMSGYRRIGSPNG